MRTFVLILLAGILSGCATFNSKWNKVEDGQTPDEVKEIMGRSPDSFSGNVMRWQADAFAICDVYFTNGKVYSKGCQDNAAARSQAQAAVFQNYMQQQSRPSSAPAQVYQMPIRRQTRTNCTSNMVGGSAYTNCSSY